MRVHSHLSGLARPTLRGVLHHYTFYGSLVSGAVLLWLAPTSQALVAAAVYGVSLSGLLGTSALYHRVTWSPDARRWMGRLDHAMIGVLIAGTYTPFGLLATSPVAKWVLAVVWGGAALLMLLHLVWMGAPKWLSALVYVALGWIGVLAMPELAGEVGGLAVGLLLAGGVFYSIGAVVYALRRPDPIPAVFGYHEVFHAFVVVGAAAHYAAVMMIVPHA